MRADDRVRGWFSGQGSSKIEEFLMPRELPAMGEAVICGVKAGAVGAIIAFLCLAYICAGGIDIYGGSIACVIAYIAVGLALGAIFGAIMARLVGRVGVFMAIGVGVIYGLLAWIMILYVIIGFFLPGFLIHCDHYSLALSSVVYGACLGIFGKAYRNIH